MNWNILFSSTQSKVDFWSTKIAIQTKHVIQLLIERQISRVASNIQNQCASTY
jgi:hypothetical protein